MPASEYSDAMTLDRLIEQAIAVREFKGGELPVVLYVESSNATFEVEGIEFNDDDGSIAMLTTPTAD